MLVATKWSSPVDRLTKSNTFLPEVRGSHPFFFAKVNYPRIYQQPSSITVTPSSTVAPTLNLTPMPTKMSTRSLSRVWIPVLTVVFVLAVLLILLVAHLFAFGEGRYIAVCANYTNA